MFNMSPLRPIVNSAWLFLTAAAAHLKWICQKGHIIDPNVHKAHFRRSGSLRCFTRWNFTDICYGSSTKWGLSLIQINGKAPLSLITMETSDLWAQAQVFHNVVSSNINTCVLEIWHDDVITPTDRLRTPPNITWWLTLKPWTALHQIWCYVMWCYYGNASLAITHDVAVTPMDTVRSSPNLTQYHRSMPQQLYTKSQISPYAIPRHKTRCCRDTYANGLKQHQTSDNG